MTRADILRLAAYLLAAIHLAAAVGAVASTYLGGNVQ